LRHAGGVKSTFMVDYPPFACEERNLMEADTH